MTFSIIENHPRPDFARPNWSLLDGAWELTYDHQDVGGTEEWHKRAGFPYRIEVPFPIESPLSGINLAKPPPVVWYLRKFDVPAKLKGRRIRLCFGAVDYHATVWVNNRLMGTHEGGYTPFSFDITDAILERGNRVVVRVRDNRTIYQVRGKQTSRRKGWGIFYTSVTGIWQSVWLEAHGAPRLKSAHIETDLDGALSLRYKSDGPVTGAKLRIEIRDPDGNEVPLPDGGSIGLSEEGAVEWRIPNPRPWSPAKPALYTYRLTVTNVRGGLSDEVLGYFGVRTIKARGGQVFLNGEPLYHRFLLNQGYFPDGVYRPGDPDRYRRDVQDALDMGYNGVRIHQKVEDPRFLYWCDRLGLLTWAEMPSFILPSKRCRKSFLKQWDDVIERDFNHPCIIAWVPFNEQWGIQNVWISARSRAFFETVVKETRSRDSTRPVVDNSGWEHLDSDILDIHTYAMNEKALKRLLDLLAEPEQMRFSLRKALFLGGSKGWPIATKPLLAPGMSYRGEPIIVSEYGGFGFYPTQKGSLLDNLRAYTLAIAQAPHIAGFCYTQQYDVEQEKNGLLTYNRSPKIKIEDIKRLNDEVMAIVSQRIGGQKTSVTPLRK